MSGIFISYRREDTKAYARLLSAALGDRFGPEQVFRDIDTMAPGVNFPAAITEAVGSCDVLLALIGNQWLTATQNGRRRLDNPDDYVRREIVAALGRDILVVPVLIEDARIPDRGDLPEAIAPLVDRNVHRLTDEGWNDGVERLLDALAQVVPPTQPPGTPSPAEGGWGGGEAIVANIDGDVTGQVAVGRDIHQSR